MAAFEIFRDQAGAYRWRLRADGDQIIASSNQGHATKDVCADEIALVRRLAPRAELRDLTRPPNQPPMASFTVSFPTGPAPLEVRFDASSSRDPDGAITAYLWDFGDGERGEGTVTSHTYRRPGMFVATLAVRDGDGAVAQASSTIVVAGTNQAPTAVLTARPGQTRLSLALDGRGSWDPEGPIARCDWDFGDGQRDRGASVEHTYARPGAYRVVLTVTDQGGLTATTSRTFSVADGQKPVDPGLVAPPVDRTVATDFAAATGFLYTGDRSIQTGVAPGTIDPRRVAILHGHVRARGGDALAGVTVTVVGHPEFGRTQTRADGRFDLAVNGGLHLVVAFERDGYLPLKRRVEVPQRDYQRLPDVAMLAAVPAVAIEFRAEGSQVLRGGREQDDEGARQPALLVPAGTAASIARPGDDALLERASLRIVEYTVGRDGPAAMPLQLPPTSGYTYAVDLAVEEANGRKVQFSQPVVFYVENFLAFPVGSPVPAGYYDGDSATWVPSDNGRVVKILSVRDGHAELDIRGEGRAASAQSLRELGVTDDERRELARLFQPGQSFWRVTIPHFSPWDFNWPYGPPPGATGPGQARPVGGSGDADPCTEAGSIIEIQNQVLGESIPLLGTPYSLHYRSSRVPGYGAARTLDITLSGARVPASLKRIELEIQIAGCVHERSFPAAPDQRYRFTWNGQDAYGRSLQGSQPACVRLRYIYPAVYQQPADFERSFAQVSGIPIEGNQARQEIALEQTWRATLGAWDARAQSLGGWGLDVLHAYDPTARMLYLGTGEQRSAGDVGDIVSTVAGTGEAAYGGDGKAAEMAALNDPIGLALAPDGGIYVTDSGNHRIRLIRPDNIITTVVGTGRAGYGGDGVPATKARLDNPDDLALAPDGSLYIADRGNQRIRRVDPAGIITTVAGNGEMGGEGDGGPATAAQLFNPTDVLVHPDGGVYIADADNHRVRRIAPDGTISTVAGTGTAGYRGDGGPATKAQFNSPVALALGRDGSLYIADEQNQRVRRVGPEGVITTVLGTGEAGDGGDGGPAILAQIDSPGDICLDANGTLYVAEMANHRIRRVGSDGIVTTLAGDGTATYGGDGGPAAAAQFDSPCEVAAALDGSIYVADRGNHRIRRLAPALPEYAVEEIVLVSDDGSELFVFDSNGRHLRTVDAYTGALRHRFLYDASGRVAAIVDGDDNATHIERDRTGTPIAVVAPSGERTTLALDERGYLARVSGPANDAYLFVYTGDGLLTLLIDPRGGSYHFAYDGSGRLEREVDPAGGQRQLVRVPSANGYQVSLIAADGVGESTYALEKMPDGGERRMNRCCGLGAVVWEVTPDGKRTTSYPNGVTIAQTYRPDPRFQMQAPLPAATTIRTPGGLEATIETAREVRLVRPGDALNATSFADSVSVNGRTHSIDIDVVGRKTRYSTPAGRRSELTWDERGRTTGLSVAGLPPTAYEYDQRGRLSKVVHGRGKATRVYQLTYDELGWLSSLTDPAGRSLRFAYDREARATTVVLPDGHEVRRQYDPNRNLVALTPPGRPPHRFDFSPVDRVVVATPPVIDGEAWPTRYEYDAARRLRQVHRPDGTLLRLARDEAGRVTAVELPDGRIDYHYDPVTGNLAEIMTSAGETIAYRYDGFLLTEAVWSGQVAGRVRFTQDNNFGLVAQRVNDAPAIEFAYDEDGLVVAAGDLTLERSAENGRLVGTELGQTTEDYAYDHFGAVTGYVARAGSSELLRIRYARDHLGRIIEARETAGEITRTLRYDYTPNGWLASVAEDDHTIVRISYDEHGNRVEIQRAGQVLEARYDEQDRLRARGGTSYQYSPAGERIGLTTGTMTTAFRYDGLGRLVAVDLPDGRRVEYVIDGAGHRVGKRMDGQLIRGYLYDDRHRVVAELDGNGGVVSSFVYASRLNLPDYMLRDSRTYRFLADHLDSPRMIVDAVSGEVAQEMRFDPFGAVAADSRPGFQPFGFAGGLADFDTGLVHLAARDYDPLAGCWLTRDPLGLAGGDSNLYRYAGGDPVNFVDPSGLIIFLQGASGDEPSLHQSICVGDPNGGYSCYSFGMNMDLPHIGAQGIGVVYEDDVAGGPVQLILDTTPEQDAEALRALQLMEGTVFQYHLLLFNCITYSFSMLLAFSQRYGKWPRRPGEPDRRPPVPHREPGPRPSDSRRPSSAKRHRGAPSSTRGCP